MKPATGCAVVAVVIFAKAPVAGYAKTRLAPALGAEGAACLAERLLLETSLQAVQAAIGPVEICATPDTTHPAFLALGLRFGVALVGQGEGDLGLRMHRAFARTLALHRGAIVIGTDAPGLGALYLRGAARALETHDAVLGPAMDGGYTLIGLRRPDATLFDDIAWSTPRVLQQTRERLARAGLSHAELAPLDDVDEPADLHHVPRAWLPPGGKAG